MPGEQTTSTRPAGDGRGAEAGASSAAAAGPPGNGQGSPGASEARRTQVMRGRETDAGDEPADVNVGSAAVAGMVRGAPAGTPSALRRPGRGPRRANLQVRRVDPWSVLKLAFVLAIALFFIWLVAVGVLYGVLDGMGVWDKLNGTYADLVAANTTGGTSSLISPGRVFTFAAVVGAINILLLTALATVGAFVYNVAADLVGGLELTLAERE
jgi:hypothetical protein